MTHAASAAKLLNSNKGTLQQGIREATMRVIATIVGLFLGAIILTSNGSSVHAQESNQKPKPVETKKVVTVKSGDSLSIIAKKHRSTYERLYYANKKIKHPDLIYPGDKIRVPSKAEKLKRREMPSDAVVPVSTQLQSPPKKTVHSTPRKSYASPKVTASTGSAWDRLAACESGGNWSINTGNGYYGGLQFSLSSWRGVGGSGYPHQASKAEQIRRAEILKGSGGWGHWPACSAKLGLR